MRKLIFLIIVLFTFNISAQGLINEAIFSKVYFSVLGGTNFNTIPTAGAAINIEIKSNITSNIFGKISIGYSTLYDNNSYETRSYQSLQLNGSIKYSTQYYAVDKVKYTIIPVNIGAEYLILKSNLSPVAFLEVGYNISNSTAEGKLHDGIGGIYNTISEIPEEYRMTAPALNDGSSFTMGVGLGIKYSLTDRTDLNIRYIYHYNDSIINYNQVLFGITF